jgi:hypothetical protein
MLQGMEVVDARSVATQPPPENDTGAEEAKVRAALLFPNSRPQMKTYFETHSSCASRRSGVTLYFDTDSCLPKPWSDTALRLAVWDRAGTGGTRRRLSTRPRRLRTSLSTMS